VASFDKDKDMGCVYLVGAGPGDPGLLTIKGRDLLASADVIVYDYLASTSLLDLCRENAELIYVGKQGGDHTMSQDRINELMIDKARQGNQVLRLKGGDPYVFGRGAEEAERLVEAGIEFEIVPGVTSAVAAPAYAGIPLTHRKYASSVCFVTGHEDAGKSESVHNWQALAHSSSTLVFFMGVKNLDWIRNNLIQAGMSKTTPAALVQWGTTCNQKSLAGSLETIADLAQDHSLRPPALLIVGEVIRLKETLNWFEKLPLLGKGIVVTRAREQASSLKALLEEVGGCCYQFPTIEIEPLDDTSPIHNAIKRLQDYDWLVFTSVNGVRYFWKELHLLGLDSRNIGPCWVAAIGPATAEALRNKGIEPDFVPRKYVAEEIVQGIKKIGVEGRSILIPRAEKAREILPQELKKAGALVKVLPVYRTILAGKDSHFLNQALEKKDIHCITFTSSSTVENFFQLIEPEHLRPHTFDQVKLACIGPITARTLEQFGFQADIVPNSYTIPDLVQAIVKEQSNNTKRSDK